jgi:predicted ATPase
VTDHDLGNDGHESVLKLSQISVSGFKALDQFKISVEPSLTVLLGMNGAGKSSILQLFSLSRHLAEGTPRRFFEERRWDRKTLRFRSMNNRSTIVHISAIFESPSWGKIRWSIRWGLNTERLQSEKVVVRRTADSALSEIFSFDQKTGGRVASQPLPPLKFEGSLLSAIQDQAKEEVADGILSDLFSWLRNIESLELLSPEAMKTGTGPSAGDMGTRGDRLAGFLEALRPQQRARVVARLGQFYRLVDLETVSKRTGWIDLIFRERFRNFNTIPSTQMSDGFMRMLALCAIPELPNASMILLDELEDGIEPHILGPLVSLVAAETSAQLIATSHSPIIANIVGAEPLRLISRTPDGRTIAAVVNEMPSFRVGDQYFGPGELWTNTELGVLEAEAQRVAGGQDGSAGSEQL